MLGTTELRIRRDARRRRRIVLVGAIVLALSLGTGVTSAWAGVAQDGRQTTVGTIDGASVYINGDSFNQPSGTCVVYSVLVSDSTSPRHVEVGLARCATGVAIDGTCSSGYSFAEKYVAPSTFICSQGLDFNNDTDYYAKIDRTGTNSMIGTVNGASVTQSGFLTSHSIDTWTWGEITGSGTACATSPSRGVFYAWTKKVSGTWSTVPSPNIYHASTGGMPSPCWGVGTYNSSLGQYDVAG